MFTDPANSLQNLVNQLIPPPDFFRSPNDPPQRPLPTATKSSRGASKKSTHRTEAAYRDQLAVTLGGTTEIATSAGRIDIVTATEIIEVKAAARWKHALGQILVYGHYYPTHQKRIHLYGSIDSIRLNEIRAQCGSYGVRMTWQA